MGLSGGGFAAVLVGDNTIAHSSVQFQKKMLLLLFHFEFRDEGTTGHELMIAMGLESECAPQSWSLSSTATRLCSWSISECTRIIILI